MADGGGPDGAYAPATKRAAEYVRLGDKSPPALARKRGRYWPGFVQDKFKLPFAGFPVGVLHRRRPPYRPSAAAARSMHRFCGQVGEQAGHDRFKSLIRQEQTSAAHFLRSMAEMKRNQALGAFPAVDKPVDALSANPAAQIRNSHQTAGKPWAGCNKTFVHLFSRQPANAVDNFVRKLHKSGASTCRIRRVGARMRLVQRPNKSCESRLYECVTALLRCVGLAVARSRAVDSGMGTSALVKGQKAAITLDQTCQAVAAQAAM